MILLSGFLDVNLWCIIDLQSCFSHYKRVIVPRTNSPVNHQDYTGFVLTCTIKYLRYCMVPDDVTV